MLSYNFHFLILFKFVLIYFIYSQFINGSKYNNITNDFIMNILKINFLYLKLY